MDPSDRGSPSRAAQGKPRVPAPLGSVQRKRASVPQVPAPAIQPKRANVPQIPVVPAPAVGTRAIQPKQASAVQPRMAPGGRRGLVVQLKAGPATPLTPHVQAVVSVIQRKLDAGVPPESIMLTPSAMATLLDHARGGAAVQAKMRAPVLLPRAGGRGRPAVIQQVKTPTTLYAFGNKAGPRLPRKNKDIAVDGNDDVDGQLDGSNHAGASTFGDISYAPLTGHYHSLAAGTDLPDGLGVVADGTDVGGSHAQTHHTIYPTRAMSFSDFCNKFASAGWTYAGKVEG